MNNKILEVKNLKTSFFTHLGEVQAVRGIDFSLEKGESLGIVGESGSGKSVTLMSILQLLQYPGKIKTGQVLFEGEDLLKKKEKELMKYRGNKISMIFQDPMTSLNPVYRIGNQIVETVRTHQKVSRKDAEKKAVEMLRLVGIPSPEKRVNNYPHEFSGGMRQRAMIAMALACQPDLLIADEPTTALDVTIQAQILELISDVKEKVNTSVILVTHDLGVIASACTKVIVMYGGLIMEEGMVNDIFYNPLHPYTVGLLKSVPVINKGEKKRLLPIKGSPPDLLNPPKGCPFALRCDSTMKICLEEQPPKIQVEKGHMVACWLRHEDAPKVNEVQRLKEENNV